MLRAHVPSRGYLRTSPNQAVHRIQRVDHQAPQLRRVHRANLDVSALRPKPPLDIDGPLVMPSGAVGSHAATSPWPRFATFNAANRRSSW